MKVSINLEPDTHALAESLAEAGDFSLSAVINRQLRNSFFGVQDSSFVRNGLLVSRSRILVTRAMVQQAVENSDVSVSDPPETSSSSQFKATLENLEPSTSSLSTLAILTPRL